MDLAAHIRAIVDFPKPGIVFRDITPLLARPVVFRHVVGELVDRYRDRGVDTVLGIESRGFLFGAPLALELGCAFVPARKPGKLPHARLARSYALEYGEATLELHADAVEKGQRVLVIDDLLATGGTAKASCELIEELGGKVEECAFVIELDGLGGREALAPRPVHSLVRYQE